jgi:hypothetical protein
MILTQGFGLTTGTVAGIEIDIANESTTAINIDIESDDLVNVVSDTSITIDIATDEVTVEVT